MDFIWIAVAVDMIVYALCGTLLYFVVRQRLPPPWNEAGTIIPLVLLTGALITMITLPHWVVFPS